MPSLIMTPAVNHLSKPAELNRLNFFTVGKMQEAFKKEAEVGACGFHSSVPAVDR